MSLQVRDAWAPAFAVGSALWKNRKLINQVGKAAYERYRVKQLQNRGRLHSRQFKPSNRNTPPSSPKNIKNVEMTANVGTQKNGKRRIVSSRSNIGRRSKGRKANRKRYRGKKKANQTESTFLRKGYVQVREQGGIENADNCAYVGHGSAPGRIICQNVFAALVKGLFALVHVNIISLQDAIPVAYQTQTLQIFTENRTSGATGILVTLAPIGALTFQNLADSLAAAYNTWIAVPGNWQTDLLQITMSEAAKGNDRTLFLKDLYVCHKTVSKLKIQNRSYTGDGLGDDDNALNTDNVPVIGNIYKAKGTGFCWKGRLTAGSTRPFYTNSLSGLIVKDGTEQTLSQLQEPPHKSMFGTKSIGCKISPGEIRTHTMVFEKKKARISDFLFKLSLDGVALATPNTLMKGFGEVAMFGLEHLLKATSDPIRVAYEVNQKHMTYVKQNFYQHTAADFTSTITVPA